MNTAKSISSTINKLRKGYVFSYSDLPIDVNQKDAAIKALNRMVASGKIAKLAKGKYYKPENTPFGTLRPSQNQVVKDLLEEDGKMIGYLTGYSIYNKLGLTTQVSNTIQIGRNQIRPHFKRGGYRIEFIIQKNPITKENIPALQLLDAIRYIKKIPDAATESSCTRFLAIIKKLSDIQINTLVRLALKYPPATRALLGALLEQSKKQNASVEVLYRSLNPITSYQLPGAQKILQNAEKWNIV
jgi:hypothetical protein